MYKTCLRFLLWYVVGHKNMQIGNMLQFSLANCIAFSSACTVHYFSAFTTDSMSVFWFWQTVTLIHWLRTLTLSQLNACGLMHVFHFFYSCLYLVCRVIIRLQRTLPPKMPCFIRRKVQISSKIFGHKSRILPVFRHPRIRSFQ